MSTNQKETKQAINQKPQQVDQRVERCLASIIVALRSFRGQELHLVHLDPITAQRQTPLQRSRRLENTPVIMISAFGWE